MEKLRVGIIGAGNIAQSSHLPVYAERDDVEVVAIADLNLERAQEAAKIFGIPNAYASVEELLEAITWRQLNLAPKPIVVLNTLGYYNNLVAMLSTAIEQGFMKKSHHRLVQLVDTPEQAIAVIEKELQEIPQPIESKY